MGRSIWWNIYMVGEGDPFMYGPVQVVSVKKVLPQGELYDRRHNEEVVVAKRERSLIQVHTDPGGLRTLAAAEIWGRNPGQYSTPWE